MNGMVAVDRSQLRLLVLSPWLPYPPHRWGAAMRTYQILRYLLRRHEVTLLTYGGPDQEHKIAGLAAAGASVRVVPAPRGMARKRAAQLASLLSLRSFEVARLRSAPMQQAIDEVLGSADYDAVLVEFSQMAGFRFPNGPALIVDEHNIEFEVHRRLFAVEPGLARKAFNLIEFAKLRREEMQTWRGFDACLLTSEREAAIVRRMAPSTRTAVIPNGVDLEYLQAFGAGPRDPDAIVFTGRMDYRPNADAAAYFATHVLPLVIRQRPRTTFYVVGQNPPREVRRLANPHVVITGAVDDVRPYLGKAAAVVAPVRAGSGTRLKILEALAMGKGLVSTRLGCEGLAVDEERDLLIADDAHRFAAQVLRLLGDPDLATRLGERGRALVESLYAWPVALAPLDELLVSLCPAGAPLVRAG